MIKKLTPHGNSLALIIDRPILDLLKIDAETPLEITTDGSRLIVAPAGNGTNGDDVERIARHVTRKHARTLKRLAE